MSEELKPTNPTENPEQAQMQRIYTRWHGAIQTAIDGFPIQPEFIAALVAGESDGDENASRFEQKTFDQLKAVRDGAQKNFDRFRQKDLAGLQDPFLTELATSYGLLQIMGYNGPPGDTGRPKPGDLKPAQGNLSRGCRLVMGFCWSKRLDARKDFEPLFRCWNTGEPDGTTFDPHYVEKGKRRMQIYAEILRSAQDDTSRRDAGATTEGQA